MTRVPKGAYRAAAIALTLDVGEFDKYSLARQVQVDLGVEYVDSRRASAWIRREHRGWVPDGPGRWRGGILRRTGAALPGPGRSGGCPASYAVMTPHLPR